MTTRRAVCYVARVRAMTAARWIASMLLLAGCDPVLNVYGSFFPAWVVSLFAGIILTVLVRQLFTALRLEEHLGLLIVVYPSLAFLLTCSAWLLFFRS
jgi:hypothetical protein